MTRLYITAPSYAVRNPMERAKALKKAQLWADAFGWEVIPSPLLSHYFAAGCWLPVAERAADLALALEHEIVWAFRGGYGAVHLAPSMLAMQSANHPLLIGYSDTTVLHAAWQVQGWGPALYGTLAESLDHSRQAESLAAFLRGQPFTLSHQSERAARVLRPGMVEAPLFAACLVVLAGLTGTPLFPDLRGKILAIEDVDERPYAVDFALHQMYQAGQLEGVAGLWGGSFHHTDAADYGGPTVQEILTEWADRLGVPAIMGLPYGHMADPLVLPAGITARMEARTGGDWEIGWDAGWVRA